MSDHTIMIILVVKIFFVHFFCVFLTPLLNIFCFCYKRYWWLSGEALQIAVKRREAKSKGEKERYKHLKAEFQRIARRDKKAFLTDQCKKIEENNRMGKTRDLFKKIRDTKGTFHAKMGSIKDRNGMDLPNRSQKILRRDGKNTQKKCTKKIFMTQIITMV